ATPVEPAVAAVNAQLAAASRIVVNRKKIGTIPLDDLSVNQREGYPAAGFSGTPVTALYWCDGHRTLAEVIRLTRLELGPSDFDFVGYFPLSGKTRLRGICERISKAALSAFRTSFLTASRETEH